MKKEPPPPQITKEISTTAKGNIELYSTSVKMPRLLWKKISRYVVMW